MKTLITGASGFVGNRLVKELQKDAENELFGISRIHRESKNNLNLITGDLNDPNFVNSLANMGFKKVFHLSWEGLPDRGKSYSELNYKISKKFLETISASNDIELNVIGSCLEYGNITGPVRDSDIPRGEDDFALAKLAIHEFIKSLDVPYKWYRPFYIYGIGQNQKSLIPSIISALSVGEEIEVKSINNSHDFVSIDDIASAIAIASKNDSIYGEINIGTGQLTCVGDILKQFHIYYGKEFNQAYSPKPGLVAQPDVLIKNAHWQPSYVGTQGMINYFQENLGRK